MHNANYPQERVLSPNDGKHKATQNGTVSPDPYYGDKSAGKEALNNAYSSSNTKQLYNIKDGKLVKFQPDGQGSFHSYEVQNPSIEVPTDVLRQMRADGLITKAEYKNFIKNN